MNDYGINAIITADSSGFTKAIQKAEQSLSGFGNDLEKVTGKVTDGLKSWGVDLGKFYDKGSSIFKDFGVDVDQFASHFGMSGALMSGIVAVTVALQQLGQEVNQISAEIAKGTGRTGDALLSLENDAKQAMIQGVALSAQEAGKAIADLNTRFGVSGDEAVELTADFASLSRVLGGDVSANINAVADASKKWGIDTADVPKLLDQLTVASQESGASLNDLLSELSSGQAIFSQFGMSITDSIAFLGSLSAEGINTSTAMTGLRTALAKFSADGEEASQGLARVSNEIKNATNQTDAMRIATETFGTRAGAEMLRVIQTESGALDDLTAKLQSAGGALKQADEVAWQTKDAMKALTTSLQGAFGGFGQGIDSLFADILDTITQFVDFIAPVVQPIGEIFREVFSFIGELLKTLVSFFVEFQQKYNTVWKSVADVLQTIYETIHRILGSVLSVFQDTFGLIFAIIEGKWELAWKYTERILLNAVKIIADALSLVVNAFVLATNGLIKAINLIVDGVNLILKPLSDLTGGFVPLLGHLNELREVDFSDSWGIKDAIETVTAEIDELTGATTTKIIGTLGEVQQTTVNVTSAIVGDWNTVFGTTESGASKTKTALEGLSSSEYSWKIKILNLEKDRATTEEERLHKQKQILTLEKEQALANAKTKEEVKQIDEYYRMLRDKLNDVADVQEENTDNVRADYSWTQKLKQQELSRLQIAMDSAVERAKAEGKSEEEIAKIKEDYLKKIKDKQLEQLELQKTIDLARSSSAEQTAEIEKYYDNEKIKVEEETTKKIAGIYADDAKEKEEQLKAIADMQQEWDNKLYQQKKNRQEKEKQYELQMMKERGASDEEIFEKRKEFARLANEDAEKRLENERTMALESAKFPEEEYYINKYYDDKKYQLKVEYEQEKYELERDYNQKILDEKEKQSKRIIEWDEKIAGQNQNAIKADMERRIEQLETEGASDDEILAKKKIYLTTKLNMQLSELEKEKQAEIEKVKDTENAEEEIARINAYYHNQELIMTQETADEINKVVSDMEKAKADGIKSWGDKLTSQRKELLEAEEETVIARLEAEEASDEEILSVKRDYLNKKHQLALEEIKNERENALSLAKTEEEKANINKYYDSEILMETDKFNVELSKMNKKGASTFSGFVDKVSEAVNKIKSLFSTIGSTIKSIASGIFEGIKTVGNGIKNFVKSSFDSLVHIVSFSIDESLDKMLEFEDKILTFFVETVPRFPEFVRSAIQSISVLFNSLQSLDWGEVFGHIGETLDVIIEEAPSLISDFFQIIEQIGNSLLGMLDGLNWDNLFGNLPDALTNILTNIPTYISAFFVSVGTLISNGFKLIDQIDWSSVFGSVGASLENILKALPETLSSFFKTANNLIKSASEGVQKIDWKGIFSGFGDMTKEFLEGLPDALSSIWDSVFEIIEGLFDSDFLDDLLTGVINMITNLIGKLPEAITDIVGLASKLTNAVLAMLPSLITALGDLAVGIVNDLPNIIDSVINGLVDFLTNLDAESIGDIIESIITVIGKLATALITNAPRIVASLVTALPSLVGALFETLPTILGNALEGAWNAATSIFRGNDTSYDDVMWDKIKGFMNEGLSQGLSKDEIYTALENKGLGKYVRELRGYAVGTESAMRGLAIVGESGPELVRFSGGEQVLSNRKTNELLSGGETNNFNVTFNNLQDTSAYTMMRQLKQYQREMAFNAVL